MASSIAKKTRQSLSTKLSEYLGGPRKVLPTEFPTLRVCLQRCLDLQRDQILMHDKNPRNVLMREIFCKVALEIAERLSTSNNELKKPTVCGPKATELRLSRGWSTFSEIARNKARKATKEQWEPKRDKLLDIAFCTCRIVLCGEDDAPGTFRKRTVKENHMTVTEEPRGRYLTHFTPEHKTRKAKPAKQCAVGLVDWLKDRGIDLSLKLIGSDTTNEMSGWKGGMLHCVAELLDKRLFMSFCWLHINE